MKNKSWKDFVEKDENEAEDVGELNAAFQEGSAELPPFEELAAQNSVLQGLLSERDNLEAQMTDAVGGGSFSSIDDDPRFVQGEIPDLATRRRQEKEREEQRQKSIEELIRQKTQEQQWLRDRDLKGRKRSAPSVGDEMNLRDQARDKLRLDKVIEKADDFFEKRDEIRHRIKDTSDLLNAPPREKKQKKDEIKDKIKDRFSTGVADKPLGFRSDQKIDNPLGKLDKAKKKFDDFKDKFVDRAPEKELKEKWDKVRDAKRKAKTLKDKFERKAQKALGNNSGGTADLDARQQKALEELAQKKEQEKIEEAKRKAIEAAEEKVREEAERLEKRREANRKKREEKREQRRRDRMSLSREERREKRREERQKERKEKGKAEKREQKRAERREENKREQRREERKRKKKDRFS